MVCYDERSRSNRCHAHHRREHIHVLQKNHSSPFESAVIFSREYVLAQSARLDFDLTDFFQQFISIHDNEKLRNGDFIKDIRNDVVGTDIAGLRLVCKADAMTQHVMTYRTNIFRYYIAATLKERICTRCQGQRYRGTGRRSETYETLQIIQSEFGRNTCGEHYINNIILYFSSIYIFSTIFWTSRISFGSSTGRTGSRTPRMF